MGRRNCGHGNKSRKRQYRKNRSQKKRKKQNPLSTNPLKLNFRDELNTERRDKIQEMEAHYLDLIPAYFTNEYGRKYQLDIMYTKEAIRMNVQSEIKEFK